MSTILKTAKANHKEARKNPTRYKEQRDLLLMQMLGSPAPNWGSVNVIITEIL